MRNQNILKIIVFLMIAVILAAGIVSCFTDVTEPNVSQTTEPPDPGQTGPVTPGDTNTSTDPEEPEKPEKPTFPRDTCFMFRLEEEEIMEIIWGLNQTMYM